MEVLVVGLRHGAGKTTVARGLTDFLDASPFKPMAANHLWSDWSTLSGPLPERLHGRDASMLADVSGDDVYRVNSVHRVWVPRPEERGGGDAFGLDRVSRGGEQVAVVNRSVGLRGDLERFVEGCDEVVRVDGLGDGVFADLHPAAVREAHSALEGDVVVESYTDVAIPLIDASPDLVLAVEPFRLHAFEADGFVEACGFLRGRYGDTGRMEVRTRDVAEVESPELSLELPLLDEVSRDGIRSAYFPVFEELF